MGIGWGNFRRLRNEKYMESEFDKTVHSHAHNNYIYLGVENGIAAVLV